MSQLILGVHSGSHDAAAALFEDYELKAAISLERLTRNKGDGTRHPDLAIDEVLSIAGATRRDVDVVCYSRSLLPWRRTVTADFRTMGERWVDLARASSNAVLALGPYSVLSARNLASNCCATSAGEPVRNSQLPWTVGTNCRVSTTSALRALPSSPRESMVISTGTILRAAILALALGKRGTPISLLMVTTAGS